MRVNALLDFLSNVWTRSLKSGSDVSCWGEAVRVAMLGPSVLLIIVMVNSLVRNLEKCEKKGCWVLL